MSSEIIKAGRGVGDMTPGTDEFYTIQRVEDAQGVTITTTDLVLTQAYVSAGKNLTIYGDEVEIGEDIRLAGHNVVINARIIRARKSASIDTSGGAPDIDHPPGDAAPTGEFHQELGSNGGPGGDGAAGTDGHAAGAISLFAERYELGGELRLVANGGVGGRGQNGGKGGDGHQGAPGEETSAILPDPFIHYPEKYPSDGRNGGNGGAGGRAGKSGNGGAGGQITVRYVVARDEKLIRMQCDAGKPGEVAAAGKGGGAGVGGPPGRSYYWALPDFSHQRPHQEEGGSVKGRDGKAGAEGATADQPRAGAVGHRGDDNAGNPTVIDYEAFRGGVHILNIPGCKAATDSWDRNKIKIPARVVASADIGALGTPAQRRLALHKAKLAYFTGGPGNIDIAVALFTWLLRVVPGPAWYASLDGSGIEAVDAFDKFRKSTDRWAGFVKNNGELAAQHERYDAMLNTFYNLKPQLTANADQWSALANSVAVQVTRLAQGLDYFGHPWNWTPVVPVDAYKTEGDRLLAAARRAEDLYNKFAALDKDQAKRKQVMQGAINDSDGKVAEIEAQIAAKITARLAVTTELDELKADLLVQEKKLQDEALVFVTKLREELQSESLAAMFTLLKDGIGLVTDVAKLVMSDGLSAAIGTLSTDTKAVTDNNKDKDKDKDKGDGKDDKKDPDWGDLFGSLSGVWDKGVRLMPLTH